MIGVTVATLLASSAFVLGMLSIHWRADHLLLWEQNVSRDHLLIALQYYVNTVGSWPARYTYVLLSVGTLQACILGSKIIMGTENNWLFDGASLYVHALPPTMPPPESMTTTKLHDLLMLLRELASTHILLSIALIGIILLQCGKYYSVRLQERERNEEVDVRLVRRLRQRQQQERENGGSRRESEDVLTARAGAH